MMFVSRKSMGLRASPEKRVYEMSLPARTVEVSAFQPELAWVAEVAVREAIEKGETGEAVESYWDRGNADGTDPLGKS
jgi:hypothetical protein